MKEYERRLLETIRQGQVTLMASMAALNTSVGNLGTSINNLVTANTQETADIEEALKVMAASSDPAIVAAAATIQTAADNINAQGALVAAEAAKIKAAVPSAP